MYLGNPFFYYFVSFLIVSITPFAYFHDIIQIFISKYYSCCSWSDVLFIYLFIIIIIWIAAFVTDAVAVNQNDIKTILGNGLSKFAIKGKRIFF